ncbi:hypothetical protein C2S52_017822 [Perilla frutescens var. hirtella]|nr:hypothetical protein C2S52_017822 [Perilla frutescens var. hirtella]
MAPVFGTVQMLKSGKSTFGLKLRLIRCYENTNSYSMECIFHDREGVRIHVTILKANVEKFKHRLIEGNVYALIDFVIGINVMKYKTTASLYKIIIFNQTRIFEVFHEGFPHHLYEIKSFVDVANMENIGDAAMFDVIGTIVSTYRPLTREINGKLTKLMDLVLEDLDGNTINATLWENYADDMINFLNSEPKAPVVIILQFCRPNIYRGDVRISSLFNITKIVTDYNISEISEFCNRYKLIVRVVDDTGTTTFLLWDKESVALIGKTASELSVGRSVEGIPSGIEQLANKKALFNVSVQPRQTRNYTGGSINFNKWNINDRRDVCCEPISKTIQQILGDGQSGEFTVFATVNSIEDISGISYLALSDCTASTTFLLWDMQCIELLGQKSTEDEILDILPPEVEGITNKKGLFTIIVLPEQVMNYRGPFNVIKVACEDSIVGATPLNQESSSKSKKGKEQIDESADEDNLIRDSLLTQKKIISNTSNAVNVMDDENVKRKLIDEFSSTTHKRNKRLLKKDKM